MGLSLKIPKIAMVLKGYPRISESFISNEIHLLEQLGMTIHIFSMHPAREAVRHQHIRHIQASVDYLPESFLSVKLIQTNLKLIRSKPVAYIRTLLSALVMAFQTGQIKTLRHFLIAGYIVADRLPECPVSHLHAHFAHSPTSIAMFAARLSGLDFSFTAHAKDIYTSKPSVLKEKMHKARFVITCTRYNQRHLSRICRDRYPRIHCVYHGIDTRLFQFRQACQSLEAPFRIITVARLVRKKGIDTVMKAVAQMRTRGMKVHYTLIGDGEQRDALLALARSLGLEQDFQWLGTLPHEQVLYHLSNAHVFALGCRITANGDRDGIPNVLMESMAVGTPVVATRISAIPELIVHEQNGLLVPTDDSKALADAITRLLMDSDLRHRVIDQARKRVAANFDHHVLIHKLADTYALYLK